MKQKVYIIIQNEHSVIFESHVKQDTDTQDGNNIILSYYDIISFVTYIKLLL